MWTKFSRSHVSFRHLVTTGFLLSLLCFPALVSAQPPTATISSVSGTVLVSMQGKAPGAATVGMVLHAGDIIETQAGAQAELTLSEGSELRLRPNTKIDIAALTQRPKTKARKSRIKLLYGKLRTFLSPGHQEEGSSFEIETPNALAGVKFSQPDFEGEYIPETKTSIFRWYTVGGSVLNAVTKERKGVPKGHQAIVQDEFLWITPIMPGVEDIPPEERQRQTRIGMFLQSHRIMGGTISPVPLSAGGRAETSQSPGPGGSLGGPRPRSGSITITEE